MTILHHGSILVDVDGSVYVRTTLFAVKNPTIKNMAIWPSTINVPLLYS